jgi:hypothetical protein
VRTPRNRRDMRPDSERPRGRRGTASWIMKPKLSEVQDRLSAEAISCAYEPPGAEPAQSLTVRCSVSLPDMRRALRPAEDDGHRSESAESPVSTTATIGAK